MLKKSRNLEKIQVDRVKSILEILGKVAKVLIHCVSDAKHSQRNLVVSISFVLRDYPYIFSFDWISLIFTVTVIAYSFNHSFYGF
jgi:hypothetical protein